MFLAANVIRMSQVVGNRSGESLSALSATGGNKRGLVGVVFWTLAIFDRE
jgi:hypothetical protein